jgi:peptide deformylase
MSDIFTYNTNDALKLDTSLVSKIPLFNLVKETHPILTQKLELFDFINRPVNPNEFASSLVETCRQHKGLGLSANQCGFPYRVFVMGAEDNYVSFFNPEIDSFSKEEVIMEEGCLSFPLLSLRIKRPKSIDVRYLDYNGVQRFATFEGLSARVFQHELDHLNGIVYTDVCKPVALQMATKKQNKLMKRMGLK